MSISLTKTLPIILIGAGLIGGLASFILTYDTFQLLQNPGYIPACNINPILSCGSIMKTAQANLLGIPNSVFGLVAFSMLLAFGVIVASGARLQRWVWLLAEASATVGVIGMHYLFFQAIFVLGTICPWCFVVWMITIPTFWYITVYTTRQGYLALPSRITRSITKYHKDILIIWYLIILSIILLRFWGFWMTLI